MRLEAVNAETVMRAGRGEMAALSRLYEECRPRLFRYLYYRVGDVQTAEDLTSEVFLRMMRALERYRPQGIAFEAWLYQIARNLAIDYARQSHLRNHAALDDQALPGQESADQAAERRLNHLVLKQALLRLGEDQRDVLVLRFISGLSIAQVAQALHKSEDAVKALQRRALSAVRALLAEWEINDASDG